MREILFRAKRFSDGEWVDGSLFVDEKKDKHEILVGYVNYRIGWEVDPETVGQFTGMTDQNGKKVFEGDIVRYTERRLGGEDAPVVNVVKYDEAGFAVHFYFLNHWLWYGEENNSQLQGIEVIGNIYDNPELLEDAE